MEEIQFHLHQKPIPWIIDARFLSCLKAATVVSVITLVVGDGRWKEKSWIN